MKQRQGKWTWEGLVRDLNPGPLAPKARIIPLDQRARICHFRRHKSGGPQIVNRYPLYGPSSNRDILELSVQLTQCQRGFHLFHFKVSCQKYVCKWICNTANPNCGCKLVEGQRKILVKAGITVCPAKNCIVKKRRVVHLTVSGFNVGIVQCIHSCWVRGQQTATAPNNKVRHDMFAIVISTLN